MDKERQFFTKTQWQVGRRTFTISASSRFVQVIDQHRYLLCLRRVDVQSVVFADRNRTSSAPSLCRSL